MKRNHLYLIVCALGISFNAHSLDIQPYGFIKAGIIGSSRAMESFGNANLSAPVRAYPTNDLASTEARTSFQLSQSRAGINIAKGQPVSGTIEVDFIDFDKATPVTKALPRLRVGVIRYALDKDDLFTIGQDWDVFSPGKPHTFNIVGLYFGAGNAGFQRPQIKWAHTLDKVTVESAIGLTGNNATTTDSDLERELYPSLSSMVAYALDGGGRVGLSAIGGRLRFTTATTESLSTFYGVNAFYEDTFGPAEVHAEVYYGENLGNTGALTLALAGVNESKHECGGYVTGKVKVAGPLSTQLGVGYAQVFEANGSTLRSITGFKVKDNLRLAAALAYRVGDSLDLFAEGSVFNTGFFVDSTSENINRSAFTVESGAVFYF